MSKLPAHIVWPGMIVGFLAMSITMVTITVIAAVDDPSFAVQSDYYERAVNWDEHRAQLEQNASLGWGVSIGLGAHPEIGRTMLTIDLFDDKAEPIGDASVQAQVFHYAKADRARRVALDADREILGRYGAPIDFDQAGRWQVLLRVERAGEVFTHERELQLADGG